ncbi:MAG: methylmalonyl-CoA mutase small subunit [Rhodospirillaceae bacterium]|nr:methylmalonyl-CoA mutase small subunit [Rhodospirillaceae bacterium]
MADGRAQHASTDEDILALAAEFGPATQEAWLKLIDKVLAGASFEKKLVSRTYDGIAIQPLYTQKDWKADAGFPGGAPYTRGTSALSTSQTGWDIRQSHGHPDPETANAHIMEDLEGGATSIALKIDPSGENGVAIRSLKDFDTALKGVLLDLAPIVLEPSGPSLPLSAVFMQLLKARGVKPEQFHGNFGADPLASFAATGKLITDMDTVLARMADTAGYTAKNFPNARALNAKSIVYHSAGAAEAQELAFVMATAIAYLRALTKAGLDIDTACGQMAFTLAVDADLFMTVAKIRAGRKLWGRIAEACGASPEKRTASITAMTAPRMMSKRDPWVNMLRTTVACFGAGIAGADAVTVLPFDHSLGYPRDLGRRIARNTQVVLQEETGANKVVDAAGGAYLFETLTDKLADTAWTLLQEIERAGGMAAALTSGLVAQKIAGVQAERAKNLSRRKDALTGVNEFPNIHEDAVVADRPDVAAALKKRDQGPVGAVAALPAPSDGALMAALVQAAGNGANVLALAKALAGTPITMTPLPQTRLSDGFEALRDKADVFKAKYGAFPKIFVANIGRVADFTARATYAKNFFEAGGIEAVMGAGGDEAGQIAAEFKRSGAAFAVLASTDIIYAEKAVDTAKALKAAGSATVYLAGRGGELENALKAAGVDDFIYMGCDVQGVLDAAHRKLAAG